MATLNVRDIPNDLYQEAKQIAQAQGRSLSAYVLMVLAQAVEDEQKRRTRAQTLANIRRRRRALPASAPESAALLRQLRHGEKE
jgi:hypothetical protein